MAVIGVRVPAVDVLAAFEDHDRAVMRRVVHQVAQAAGGVVPLLAIAHIRSDRQAEFGAAQVRPQRALAGRIGGTAHRVAGRMPVAVAGSRRAAARDRVVHAAGRTAAGGAAAGVPTAGRTTARPATGIAADLLLTARIRVGSLRRLLGGPRIDLRLHGHDVGGLAGLLRGELVGLRFQLLPGGLALFAQRLQVILPVLRLRSRLGRRSGLLIGLRLQLGDLVLNGGEPFLTVHGHAQFTGGVGRRVRLGTGHGRLRLHTAHEFVRGGGIRHHAHQIGCR